MCISICTGQPFLEFNTYKNDCLYLALEDSYNRLQKRLKKVLNKKEIPSNFHLAINCEPLNEGLIEELESYLKEYPKIKLIIIDTFQKIRGHQGKSESAYSYDYKECSKLKRFADQHELCILLIHHLRKMKDKSDPYNQISGSTGLIGSADTEIVIAKSNYQDSEVLISMTGRDIKETEKILTFDIISCKCGVVGNSNDFQNMIERFEYENNPIIITIKKLLEEQPEGLKITSSDLLIKIYEFTGSYPSSDKPNTLSREIKSNLQFQLLKFDGIYYEPPNENGGSAGRKMYFAKPKKDTNI